MGDRFACARDIRRQVSGLSKSEGGDHDDHRTHPRIAGRVECQRSPACAQTAANSPKVSSPEPVGQLDHHASEVNTTNICRECAVTFGRDAAKVPLEREIK